MQEQHHFVLILNSKFYKIPFLFNNLTRINSLIFYSLISHHRYQVKSKINEIIFQSFIDYLVNDKLPGINYNNIDEYSLLNQEFQFEPLRDMIEMIYEFDDPFYNLDKIGKASPRNQILIEEKIAQNLDKCILKYYDKMLTLSVDRLIRIFNHPKRKLEDHNISYNFICLYYDEIRNKKIFSLLQTLEAKKLDKSKLNESISLYKSRGYQFLKIDIPDFFENYEKIFEFLVKNNEIDKEQLKRINFLLYDACIERDVDTVKWLTREEIKDKSGFSYKIDKLDKKAAAFSYLNENGDAFIPRSIQYQGEEYLITSILDDPDGTKKIIKTIRFDDNSQIKIIGKRSFNESLLKCILIPSTVEVIGNSSFMKCKELETVKFSQDSQLILIEPQAFELSGIKEISIPSKTKIIDESAFNLCQNLTNVYFEKKSELQVFKKNSLSSTNIEKIYIPAKVRSIESSAFFLCHNLKTLEFDKNIKSIVIDMNVFPDCLEYIQFPECLVEFSDYSFYKTNIKEIKIPESNKNFKNKNGFIIGKTELIDDDYNTFLFLLQNKEIMNIPPNIKVITSFAFNGSLITKVSIPAQVRQIKSMSFSSCPNLQVIEIDNDSKYISFDSYCLSLSSIEKIVFPSGFIEFKKNWCHDASKLIYIQIPESNKYYKYQNGLLLGKTELNSDNFDIIIFARRDINNVNIPSNIKIISSSAFEGCANIKTINFPQNSKLFSIKECAFNLSSIEYIDIPASVTNIGDGAFNLCKKIRYCNIHEKSELKSIGQCSFAMSFISNITIPDHISTIEYASFSFCDNIKYINISENSELQTICESAFSYSSIECFYIPKHVNSIDESAFYHCNELKIIEIAENSELQSIEQIFLPYKSIEIIVIPVKVM